MRCVLASPRGVPPCYKLPVRFHKPAIRQIRTTMGTAITGPLEAEPLRKVSTDQILHRLREMFGEDRARLSTGDPFRVVDEPERVVAFPQNIGELSELLKLAED